MTKKEKEQTEAIATLKEWGVVDGTMIHAQVMSVSSSGMSRRVQLFIVKNNEMINITYWASKALQWTYCDSFPRGIRVGGCGMDMLFHTIDCLSYRMGYGAICQDDRATEPTKKRSNNGEDIVAIGLKYHAI